MPASADFTQADFPLKADKLSGSLPAFGKNRPTGKPQERICPNMVDRILRIVYNMLSKGLFRHSTGNGGRRKHTGGSSPQIRKLKLNANNKTQSASSLAFAA